MSGRALGKFAASARSIPAQEFMMDLFFSWFARSRGVPKRF